MLIPGHYIQLGGSFKLAYCEFCTNLNMFLTTIWAVTRDGQSTKIGQNIVCLFYLFKYKLLVVLVKIVAWSEKEISRHGVIEAINCSLLWIMSKFAAYSQPYDGSYWLKYQEQENMSWNYLTLSKLFQSVLQQASSLMSQGEDHLLSTIQVSLEKYFLTK